MARREALARQLLLDGDLGDETAVRETLEFDLGVLRDRLVRDREDILCRADGSQPAIDEALTARLRGRRTSAAPGGTQGGLTDHAAGPRPAEPAAPPPALPE